MSIASRSATVAGSWPEFVRRLKQRRDSRLEHATGKFVLARYFQFYVKKRGGRRTDSPMIGSLALTLFFALLLLVGVGFFAALVLRLIVPEWRAQHRFVATQGVVLKTSPRPVGANNATKFRPDVLVQYQADGTNYQTWTYDVAHVETGTRAEVEKTLEQFVVGREVPCWYDPDSPDNAVVVRGYHWSAWLMTILPLSLVIVGGGGLAITLLNWGKSAERRAALVQRRLNLEIFDPVLAANRLYPTLPPDANLTNSPGTTLKFRLPMDVAPKWTIWTLSGVALGVMACAAFFGYWAYLGHRRGDPDWFMTVFATVCGAASIGITALVVRAVVRDAALGATIVEVSEHPWHPGEHYELFLNQGGRLNLGSLEMRLVCEEKATFAQGTNSRTERACVYQETLFQRDDLAIGRPEPFEARCELTLPAGAMHSFAANHNEVAWRLVVEGKGDERHGFARSFPVVIYPPREQGETP